MTGQEWKQAVLQDFPWTRDMLDLVEEGVIITDELNRVSGELLRLDIRVELDEFCRVSQRHGRLARKIVAVSKKLGILPVGEKRERRIQRWRSEHPDEV